MKVVGVIPARHKSTRYPGKPLVPLLGKPMVIWVAELTAKALGKENVYIATEDVRISETVERYGFNSILTSDIPLTGTDRLCEAAKQLQADIFINVQGDEPMVNPTDIKKIVNVKLKYPDEVINGMFKIGAEEDPNNINIPKVITTEDNRMVYMSRKALPGFKSEHNTPQYFWKQVCIYAYNKQQLDAYANFGRKSILESYEDIEILRFLDLKIPVRMVETSGFSYAIDVPSDVEKVENALKESLNW